MILKLVSENVHSDLRLCQLGLASQFGLSSLRRFT